MNDIERAIENYKKSIEYIEKDLICRDEELYKMDKPTRDEIESAKRDHLLAIQALERQIPKKTIIFTNNDDIKIGRLTFKGGCTIHKCPVCKTIITSDKYCPECGQRVERSES